MSGSAVPKCLTNNWYRFVTARVCAVWLSAISSLPGLCAPSLLLSCSTAPSASSRYAAFGLGLSQHLTSEPGPTSGQGAQAEELREGTCLVTPCFGSFPVNPFLPSGIYIWLRGSTCARGTITCVYPGSSSILCVSPCSSCISVSPAFSCASIILLVLKIFGT